MPESKILYRVLFKFCPKRQRITSIKAEKCPECGNTDLKDVLEVGDAEIPYLPSS